MIFNGKTWAILFTAVFALSAFGQSVRIGDIQIDPEDFSSSHNPDDRIAKCLACHGKQAGGDIDFGPDAHFGTPAIHGMRKTYLRAALAAYRDGSRSHEEMSAVAAMLDAETIEFMARSFADIEAPPMRSAGSLATLAEEDPRFRRGQVIAKQGIPEKGVPPCMACHGPLGEGSDIGPRLAGQNSLYIKRQFEAFSDGSRQTVGAATMRPAVVGLNADEVDAVAHYYESVQKL